jgi:N-acetylneuraminic acid mutarotase
MRVAMWATVAVLAVVSLGFPEDWNQFPAPNLPSERFGAGRVVLDDGRVLIFGGMDVRGELINDLYVFGELEGLQFERMETTDPPPGRLGATMTQVSESEVALFGGQGKEGVLGDLWILDLGTSAWRRVSAEGVPPRKFHCAWYHGATGRLYIAGGVGRGGKPLRDLYSYSFRANRWERGPDAPEEFWGAYAAVHCEGPCSAVVLGPVSLTYDMVRGAWGALDPGGDVPPPKHLATFAVRGDRLYMFGGLYLGESRVFVTPCTFSYDITANRWTYHHAVPPPYGETGLWWANAFHDAAADAFYILGGLVGWPFDDLGDFLAGGWAPSGWPLNDRVYVFRPG